VEGSCEHGNEPSGFVISGEVLGSCTIDGFPRRARLHEVNLVKSTRILFLYVSYIK
jgi:hypothetical protein